MGLWNKDPLKWKTTSLKERLEALRKHYCRGPGGSCCNIENTASELNKALKEAIAKLPN